MNQSVSRPRVIARQGDDVLWRQLDDRVLVLDVSRSRYLRLNRSGTLLWRALREPRTVDELVDHLRRSYDVSHEDATTDVEGFLADLREHGLLEAA